MPDVMRRQEAAQISFTHELWRKGTHMGALAIPVFYYVSGFDKYQMSMIMVPAFVAMILLDIARLRNWVFWRSFAGRFISPLIRAHEHAGDFTGAFYILGSMCVSIALFSKPIAIAALAFTIVGDTFAALIGRKYGRHRFNGKSVEGSLGCLVGTSLVALAMSQFGLPLMTGLVGALAATIAEAVSFKIDDNVSVPLVSGLIMSIFGAIFHF
ncbi:MAG: hypothetical protein RBT76_06150 [candidate division Zixibacteria bacterium]|nr:hypothetical protein [candidate division Zixibacteria bacterium]